MGCHTSLYRLIPFNPKVKKNFIRNIKNAGWEPYCYKCFSKYYGGEVPLGAFFEFYTSWVTELSQHIYEKSTDNKFIPLPDSISELFSPEYVWEFPVIFGDKEITKSFLFGQPDDTFPWVRINPYDVVFFKKQDFLDYINKYEQDEILFPEGRYKINQTQDYLDLRKAMENFIDGKMFIELS